MLCFLAPYVRTYVRECTHCWFRSTCEGGGRRAGGVNKNKYLRYCHTADTATYCACLPYAITTDDRLFFGAQRQRHKTEARSRNPRVRASRMPCFVFVVRGEVSGYHPRLGYNRLLTLPCTRRRKLPRDGGAQAATLPPPSP